MYLCIYVCMYLCMCVCMNVFINVCTCMNVCMLVCLYVCIYVCMLPSVSSPCTPQKRDVPNSLSNICGWIRLIRSPVQPSQHEKLHRCLIMSFIYRFHFILFYNPVHFDRCFLPVSPLTQFLLKFESPLHFYPLNSPGRHLQHLSF